MKKKIIFIIIGVVVITIALIILLPTEKKRLKNDIKAFSDAVEKENKAEALKYIDVSYLDRRKTTYEMFANNMDNIFNQFDSMNVIISGLKIEIDSIDDNKTIYASCSLGLKIFAKYEGDRALVFGGIIRPESVKAYFKKSDKKDEHYKVYHAEY